MTIYSEPFYTRAELDAARPAVSRRGRYPFAHCLSIREGLSGIVVVDYADLYAWNFYELPALPRRFF